MDRGDAPGQPFSCQAEPAQLLSPRRMLVQPAGGTVVVAPVSCSLRASFQTYGIDAATGERRWEIRGAPLWLAGLGLVLLGIGLELAQGAFTTTRMADPADALANAAGVALGLLTVRTPWRDALLGGEGCDG